MKRRFVILLDTITEEQEKAVRAYIEEAAGWWHWLPNVWLLADPTGALTASTLRDNLRKFIPATHMVVLEFSADGDTWSGFGPTTDKKDMFGWIRKNWNKSH